MTASKNFCRGFDGTLYVGGWFRDTKSDGRVNAQYLAKWNGTAWQALGAAPNGKITALAWHNGALYVGGHFTSIGGIAATSIAKWTGTQWQTLGTVPTNSNYRVEDLCSHGGQLYAAGVMGFDTSNNALARWNGSVWTVVLSSGTSILCLTSGSDGLYCGSVSGSARRLATNDTWTTIGDGLNDRVLTLAFSESLLYAGGSFTKSTASGQRQLRHLVRLTGTTWSEVGSGVDDIVWGLAPIAGGVAVSGNFVKTGSGTELGKIGLWQNNAWIRSGNSTGEIGLGSDVHDYGTSVTAYQNQIAFGLGYASVSIPAAKIISPLAAFYILPTSAPPTPPAPVINGIGTRPVLSGTAVGATQVKIYQNAVLVATVTTDGSGQWTSQPTGNLPDGWFSFTVVAVDTNGNTSFASSQTLFLSQSRNIILNVIANTQWTAISPSDATICIPINDTQSILVEQNQITSLKLLPAVVN